MKKLKNDKWAHPVCVNLIPEIYYKEDGKSEEIKQWNPIPKIRYNKKCSLCKQTKGVVLFVISQI